MEKIIKSGSALLGLACLAVCGAASAQTTLSSPGRLDQPAVAESGLDSLSVSWEAAPAAPGFQPGEVFYDLQYREFGDGAWTDGPQDVDGLGATLAGLTADTVYDVRVRAAVTGADGQWSEPAQGVTALWSATLDARTWATYTGYHKRAGVHAGELTPSSFTFGTETFRIPILAQYRGNRLDENGTFTRALDIYFAGGEISADWELRIGDGRYSSSDAVFIYFESYGGIGPTPEPVQKIMWRGLETGLRHGQTRDVTLSRTLFARDIPGAAFLASFRNYPEYHSGADAFTAEIRFTAESDLTRDKALGGAVQVRGGAITDAAATNRDHVWRLTIMPSGSGDVEVVVPAGRACNLVASVCAADRKTLSRTASVTVPGPQPPVIATSETSYTVTEGETFVASFSATDADSGEAALRWAVADGDSDGRDGGHFNLSGNRLGFRAAKDFENPDDADADGVYEVTLRVSDGARHDDIDIAVTLANRNEAPVVNAGPDRSGISEGARVALTGSAEDPENEDTLRFAWRQISGPDVTLSGANTASAAFTSGDIVADTTYSFRLSVTDSAGMRGEDEVSVTVAPLPAAHPPPALASFDAREDGVDAILAHWTPPENRYLPLTGYDLQYRALGDSVWIDFTGSFGEASGEITGLATDSTYQIRVRARNAAGTGPWSPTAEANTAFWEGTLTVGSPGGGQPISGYVGYRGHSSSNFGSLGPSSFTYDQVEYVIVSLLENLPSRYRPGTPVRGPLELLVLENALAADWLFRFRERQLRVGAGAETIADHPQSGQTAHKFVWNDAPTELSVGSAYEVAMARSLTAAKQDSGDSTSGGTAADGAAGAAENESADGNAADDPPVVSGPPQEGGELRANPEDGTDAERSATSETGVSWQWLRSGEPIAGATDRTYVLAAEDVGETVSVRKLENGVARESAPTVPVWPAAGNLPLAEGMEELFSATVTLESQFMSNATLSGYSAHSEGILEEYGSISNDLFEDGGRRLLWASMAARGRMGLDTSPKIEDVSDIEMHWDRYVVELTEKTDRPDLDDPDEWVWFGWSQDSGLPFKRYWHGASDGVKVALSIRRRLPRETAQDDEAEQASPTATFSAVPESHDGTGDFELELTFSGEPAGLGYATVRDSLLQETGGAVRNARRKTPGSNAGWILTVRPDGPGDVTLRLPARACGTANAVCIGGEALAAAASVTVPGPPFTASFDGAPAAHGGAEFKLNFRIGAEPAGLSFVTVRDGLFDVAGGSISGVRRLTPGSNRDWELTASPSGAGPVTLALIPTTDCDTAPGVCDALGRKLSGPLSLTVPGTAARTDTQSVLAPPIGTGAAAPRSRERDSDAPDGVLGADRWIDFDLASAPTGAWSDGALAWVISDWRTGEVKVYSLDTGRELPGLGFRLRDVGYAADLWSDGGALYAADYHGGVRAFALADGARLPAADFDSGAMAAAGNAAPTGLWSDGEFLWVADAGTDTIFAYRLADRSRAEGRDIPLELGLETGGFPLGLWSDGETLLAVIPEAQAARAYDLRTGARLPGRDFDLGAAGVFGPVGLTGAGAKLWIVDSLAKSLSVLAASITSSGQTKPQNNQGTH